MMTDLNSEKLKKGCTKLKGYMDTVTTHGTMKVKYVN